MKEKLIIKNFGPINEVELDLSMYNIVIGDQGTGKSTVAKILVAIRNVIIRDPAEVSIDWSYRNTQLFLKYLKDFGIYNYLYPKSEIYFSNSISEFEFKRENVVIREKVTFSEDLYSRYDFTYIPSERNLIIPLVNSLFALLETGTALPQLFLRFGDKFQKARIGQESFDYLDIIGVKYRYKKGGDIIVLSSDKEIFIQESSSGIQGVITMLTVFDYASRTSPLLSANSAKSINQDLVPNFLVIEEPELNCFPNTQYAIIKHIIEHNFLIATGNEIFYKNQILLTTHSPYVLTSLNNLMYAFQTGKEHSVETNSIIERKYWLNPDDVSAYIMLPGGNCEDIFDREEGMIKAEKIDAISSLLNQQLDSLLNLEFKEN